MEEEAVAIDIPTATIAKMKVKELRDELKIRRKMSNGSKADLVARLIKAIADKAPVVSKKEEAAAADDLKGFPPGARWVPLEPSDELVVEPPNLSFNNPRAPTDDEGNPTTLQKKNFPGKFDVPVFVGLSATKKKRQNAARGLPTTNYLPRKAGEPSTAVTLDASSHPAEFMELFLPFDTNQKDDRQNKFPSFATWASWTNTKAIMAGAGDSCYKEFKPFSRHEIRQHFGLYILQGLSPSPSIEMKFKPQSEDPVAGKDLVYNAFGPNAERRHKHFRAFFASQNPLLPVPSKKTHPNSKFVGVCLVNAYEIYKKKCQLEGKAPMSHYKFREKICLAWISPDKYQPQTNTPVEDTTIHQTRASRSESDKKRKRREYMTTKVYDQPAHVRLDATKRHWAKPCVKRTKCKVHRLWNRTTFHNVFECQDCNVEMCLGCWESFHTIPSWDAMEKHLTTHLGPKDGNTTSRGHRGLKKRKKCTSATEGARLSRVASKNN